MMSYFSLFYIKYLAKSSYGRVQALSVFYSSYVDSSIQAM